VGIGPGVVDVATDYSREYNQKRDLLAMRQFALNWRAQALHRNPQWYNNQTLNFISLFFPWSQSIPNTL